MCHREARQLKLISLRDHFLLVFGLVLYTVYSGLTVLYLSHCK